MQDRCPTSMLRGKGYSKGPRAKVHARGRAFRACSFPRAFREIAPSPCKNDEPMIDALSVPSIGPSAGSSSEGRNVRNLETTKRLALRCQALSLQRRVSCRLPAWLWMAAIQSTGPAIGMPPWPEELRNSRSSTYLPSNGVQPLLWPI